MATSKVLKPRRGSTAEHDTFKGQAFEVTFDTDKKTLVMHDGLTMGGFPLAHESSVAETDSALRTLIDQKVAEVEGVSSSELQALDLALRGLINSQAQQQAVRDTDQDNVVTALDSALRTLIAQYLPLAGGTLTGMIHRNGTAIRTLSAGQNLNFLAGVDGAENGGGLFLYDDEAAWNTGGFLLRAAADGNAIDFRGEPNGNLAWNGKNIVRTVNGVSADAAGAVTIGTNPTCHYWTERRTALVLPSGGTWLYWVTEFVNAMYNGGALGTAAGGTTVKSAISSGGQFGIAIKIA